MDLTSFLDLNQTLSLIIGIILTILGSILMAAGSTFMKLGLHLESEKQQRIVTYPCNEPAWWGGIGAYSIGAAFHVVGLGFAPASVLAPMNSIGLIANAISAATVLQEPLGWLEIFSTCGTMAGVSLCACASFFRSENAFVQTSKSIILDCWESWKDIWYMSYMGVGTICVIAALVYVVSAENYASQKAFGIKQVERMSDNIIPSSKIDRRLLSIPETESTQNTIYIFPATLPRGIGVTYGFLAGIIGAQCVLELKELVICAQHPMGASGNMWNRIEPYLLLSFLFASVWLQIHFLNLGLGRGDATLVVPTYYIFWTLFGTLGGFAKFNEFEGYGTGAITLFCLGFLITVACIAILAVQEVAFLRRFVDKRVPDMPEELMDLKTQDLLDQQMEMQLTLGMGLFPFSMIGRTVGRKRYQSLHQRIRRTRSTASDTALDDTGAELSLDLGNPSIAHTLPHNLRFNHLQQYLRPSRLKGQTMDENAYFSLNDDAMMSHEVRFQPAFKSTEK